MERKEKVLSELVGFKLFQILTYPNISLPVLSELVGFKLTKDNEITVKEVGFIWTSGI